jgi:hypothetical protein
LRGLRNEAATPGLAVPTATGRPAWTRPARSLEQLVSALNEQEGQDGEEEAGEQSDQNQPEEGEDGQEQPPDQEDAAEPPDGAAHAGLAVGERFGLPARECLPRAALQVLAVLLVQRRADGAADDPAAATELPGM